MPFHKKQTWVVVPIASAEALADTLIGRFWCSCQGWGLGRYLFLNDQTGADGAFEVAVVNRPDPEWGDWFHVETITYGWFLERPAFGWAEGEYARDCLAAVRRAEESIRHLISVAMDPGQPGNVAWAIGRPDLRPSKSTGSAGIAADPVIERTTRYQGGVSRSVVPVAVRLRIGEFRWDTRTVGPGRRRSCSGTGSSGRAT